MVTKTQLFSVGVKEALNNIKFFKPTIDSTQEKASTCHHFPPSSLTSYHPSFKYHINSFQNPFKIPQIICFLPSYLFQIQMVKNIMKLPSLFKNKETKQQQQPWQWPLCNHPKTLSFRAGSTGDDMFKTVNSVFFDPNIVGDGVETPESWFTNSSESASHNSTESSDDFDGESLELVVRGVRSERLFFEPGADTSSILGKAKDVGGFPFKESVVLAMDSEDPYVDFRRSMEEMVESHGLKDWECLEELLGWYLRVNGKKNHGFIVGAFVDLLVGLNASNSCSDSTSYSSAVSSFSCSLLCSSQGQSEIDEVEKVIMS
jgi:uncharacterized protein (TIGR01568 family)